MNRVTRAAGDAVPHGIGVEAREHLAGRAGPQGAGNNVDDAVHVVQGQAEEDAIVGRPLPGVDQSLDLGGDVGVGCDYAFGTAGGAAGVEDHGATVGRDIRSDVWRVRWCVCDELLVRECAEAAGCGDWLKQGSGLRIEDQSRYLGIIDKVLQLGLGGVERQGDGNSAGAPDAPLRGYPRKSGRDEKSDASLVKVVVSKIMTAKIVATGYQCRCYARRCVQKFLVGE